MRAEFENWKVNFHAFSLTLCTHPCGLCVACCQVTRQVWENVAAVAIDVGAFSDVILAFNRILDLKKTFGDWEVGLLGGWRADVELWSQADTLSSSWAYVIFFLSYVIFFVTEVGVGLREWS